MTFISRSEVGSLSDPDGCAWNVADRFANKPSSPLMLVVDADAKCYASAISTTIDKMLMKGRLALIGTYNSKCPLHVIAGDIRETAKEYGIK